MTYFKINADDLRDLLYDSVKLHCLEEAGVDNWFGYMENRIEFIAKQLEMSEEEVDEQNLQLQDVADKWIQDYDVLER